jgi:hypothetical protein
MAFATFVIWLFLAYTITYFSIRELKVGDFNGCLIVFVGFAVISLLGGVALFWDIYKELPYFLILDIKVFLLAGLSGLFIISAIKLYFKLLAHKSRDGEHMKSNRFASILDIISLIASILGIISFYLDYLK